MNRNRIRRPSIGVGIRTLGTIVSAKVVLESFIETKKSAVVINAVEIDGFPKLYRGPPVI